MSGNDIDLDRVVNDPDYRRKVLESLKAERDGREKGADETGEAPGTGKPDRRP